MSQDKNGPIFLIGAARSGTKFARAVLASSDQTSAIDYDVNYIWRYGNDGVDHDELDPNTITPKIRAHIVSQLYRLAKILPESRTVLIEKTVSNTLRVPFIEKVFPNARYIHLIRDGRAVTESSMRMWQAPPDTGSLMKKLRQMPLSSIRYILWFGYNFGKGIITGRGGGQVWGPRYKGIMDDVNNRRSLVEICARQWQSSVENASVSLAQIDPKRVFTLSYSDLVCDENKIQELLDFLELQDQENIIEFYRKNVRADNDEKWHKTLSDEDVNSMMKIIKPSLLRFGFINNRNSQSTKEGRN